MEDEHKAIEILILMIIKIIMIIGSKWELVWWSYTGKIIHVWLAENGWFFHVTRGQNCNTSAKLQQKCE